MAERAGATGAPPAWRQRARFFLAGLSVGLVLWGGLGTWILFFAYGGSSPPRRHPLQDVIVWTPWALVGLVLVLRLTRGPSIRLFSYAFGTASSIAVLVVALALKPVAEDLYHRRDFDAALWRDETLVDHDVMWPPRLCMVDDLLASGRLIGLTREEVVELLGPPEEPGFPLGAVDCDVFYHLGPERGFLSIDSEWLFLALDQQGRVHRAWIYRD